MNLAHSSEEQLNMLTLVRASSPFEHNADFDAI